MQQIIGSFRMIVLFRGIAALLFGIIIVVWPGRTVSVLVLVFGVFVVINGMTIVAMALRNRGARGWGLLLFEGILSLLAGVIALAWPGSAALAFFSLLAAWAIVTGIVELLVPLSFPLRGGGRAVVMGLAGVVSIVFGILLAAQPASGVLAVTWMIGVYALVIGLMYVVMYFQSRVLTRSLA